MAKQNATSDIHPLVAGMTKDKLYSFGISDLGVELDLTRPIQEIKREASNLLRKREDKDGVPADAPPKANARFLKHPKNKRVYVATARLLKRGDMIPCDAKGRPVGYED